jgi:hypothetical protein
MVNTAKHASAWATHRMILLAALRSLSFTVLSVFGFAIESRAGETIWPEQYGARKAEAELLQRSTPCGGLGQILREFIELIAHNSSFLNSFFSAQFPLIR